MPLNIIGSRIAHYDVTALIGEGGMGQVYQATDTKLHRHDRSEARRARDTTFGVAKRASRAGGQGGVRALLRGRLRLGTRAGCPLRSSPCTPVCRSECVQPERPI